MQVAFSAEGLLFNSSKPTDWSIFTKFVRIGWFGTWYSTRNVKSTNTRNYYKWQFSLSLLNFRECMAWVVSIWAQLSLFTRFDAPRKDFPFLGASKRVVVVVACHVAVERRSAKEVTKYQYLGMGLHLLFPFLLLPLGIPFSSPPTSKGFRLGLCGGK